MEASVKKPNFLMRGLESRLTISQFTAKQILALYLPMLLDQFSVYGMSLLSSSMVSASSQEAISAMSLVSALSYLLVSMFAALSTGGTVLVAQAKGRGDELGLRRACGQTILLTCSMGLVITGVLYFGAGFLVETFYGGAAPLIVEYGIIYLKLYGLSLFPLAIFNSISCCFAGMGKSKHCLVLSVIINVVHLIMSFIFINMMKMGISGIGYAYIVARLVGGLVTIVMIFLVRNADLRFKDLWYLSWDFVKKILRPAIPVIVGAIMSNGGSILANSYIAPLEVNAVAAHSIAGSIFGMFMLTTYGLMTLTTTVCGQCIGAKNYDLSKHYVKQFSRLGR